jgi:hypothetical protein
VVVSRADRELERRLMSDLQHAGGYRRQGAKRS